MAVAVVNQHKVGVLRHLVEHVRVVHQLGVAPAQLHRFHKEAEGLEQERLAAAAVAFAVLAYLVVHGHGGPRPRGAFVVVQHVAYGKELADKVLLLLVPLFGREALAVDAELVGAVVGFGLRGIALGKVVLQLLAPVHAARVDYVAKQGAALGVLHLHPEARLARGRHAALHLKHGGHERDAVVQHILLPHIAVEPVAPGVLHKPRGGGLNRFAGKKKSCVVGV